MRRRTHIAQRLPEDYEDKITDFQRFIITQQKRDNYEADQIGNADQTHLTSGIPHSTTIDTKGSSSVNIKTAGNEKDRLTYAGLHRTWGGRGEAAALRHLQKKDHDERRFPPGVIVRNHEKRWMDETLTLDWIKSIWGKRPGADKVYLRWTLSGATKQTKLSGPWSRRIQR